MTKEDKEELLLSLTHVLSQAQYSGCIDKRDEEYLAGKLESALFGTVTPETTDKVCEPWAHDMIHTESTLFVDALVARSYITKEYSDALRDKISDALYWCFREDDK